MRAPKKTALLLLLILIAAGIGFLVAKRVGQLHNSARGLENIGKSWDPERIRRIAAEGRLHSNFTPHEPTTIRLSDPVQLEILQQGEPALAASRSIEVSAGSISFPADGTAWGEHGSCMIWQFDGMDLAAGRDFGGIEVQITNHRSGDHKFHISFSVWSPDNLDAVVRTATIPLVPERTMKYVILPDMSAQPDNAEAVDSKTITLVFPDLDRREDVEILSVEVLSKIGGYTGASLGAAYESLDEETRPVIYQWTGGAASWSVAVPAEKDCALKFGTGLLPNSSPVTFTISVDSNGNRREIFRKTMDKGDTWRDYVVSLGSCRGQEMQIIFAVESSESNVALWSSPRIVQTDRKGKLICIYLIDAMRPDFIDGISRFHGRKNFTPAMRGLAEAGVTFTEALANAPVTKYSMPTLFSGLYPSHTGVMTYQRVPDDIQTLAEDFRGSGYLTASFLFNGNSGRLRGLHQGFDHLFSIGRVQREAIRGDESNADAILNMRAMISGALINNFLYDFIRSHKEEDVLLFIHLMDTHMPYFPDEEFVTGFNNYMSENGLAAPHDRAALFAQLRTWYGLSAAERLPEEAVLELYRGTVETADKHLQRFLNFLDTEGLKERSTIVLTADHGEHLTEHPGIGPFIHMRPMLLEVLRVPLIIMAPGSLPAGRRISTPVQLADVMPTLLDIAGIPYDASRFDGTSLLLLMAGGNDPFFSERPIVSQSYPSWSVLVNDTHSPDITIDHRALVFNIDRDPREHAPLKGTRAGDRLRMLIESLAVVPRRSVPETETIVNDEETLKQLKALGYIQ